MVNFQQGFQLINGTSYAFGCFDRTANVFTYYPATLLPPGVNPAQDTNRALVYLINQFINTRDPNIHFVISFLKPSMRRWNHEHFVNYLGNGEVEYSSDSDNDARDTEAFSEDERTLSSTILQRVGYQSKPLSSRLRDLVRKTGNRTLASSSVENFLDKRQQYFSPVTQEAGQIIKIGKSEFKSEIELINIAINTKSLKIKSFQEAGKPAIEISGEYNNESVRYVLRGQYFLPLFRGISYLVDRWNDTARRAHRRLPIERDPVNYAEANIKTIPGFYHLDTYENINFDDLHKNAKMLKAQLLKFKLSPPTILQDTKTTRQFGNFLEYMQYVFSNGIDNFILHLDEFNKKFPGVLPNNGNPFVPFSHLPFHAVRYAFGEKNPYKDFSLPPLWDQNGRPRKPHVGKLVLSVHPLIDFLNMDEPNIVPYLTNVAGVTVPKVIGAEYEVSFLSFIHSKRLFKQRIIRYPSFHKPYHIKYLAKYGLTQDLFEGFKACIVNPATQDSATEVLKGWLCLFHAVKAMDQISQEIARRQGIMLFFHPDGSLQPRYPSENYESNPDAIARSMADARANLNKAELVLRDSQSWSTARSISVLKLEPSTPNTPSSRTSNGSHTPRTPLSRSKPPQRPLSLSSRNAYKTVSPHTPDDPDSEAFSVSFERQISILEEFNECGDREPGVGGGPYEPSKRLPSQEGIQAHISEQGAQTSVPKLVQSPVHESQEVQKQFEKKTESEGMPEQLGWNCFDIAVGIKDRQELVKYALEQATNIAVRRLLAPEIMHAVAATSVYLKKKATVSEAEAEATQARGLKLLEFFEVSSALKDTVERLELEAEVDLFLEKTEESKNRQEYELRALEESALPVVMHSDNVCKLADEYYDAYQLMVGPVRECNRALFPERFAAGQLLSLEELDKFFLEAENRNLHEQKYENFKKARDELFSPFESRFYEYCESEETYKTYVQEYYGNNKWFAFQRHFADSNETSMVDVGARMLQSRIFIHDARGNVIYETKNHEAPSEIHIDYNGHNHFTSSRPIVIFPSQGKEASVAVGEASSVEPSISFTIPKPVTWLAPNTSSPVLSPKIQETADFQETPVAIRIAEVDASVGDEVPATNIDKAKKGKLTIG